MPQGQVIEGIQGLGERLRAGQPILLPPCQFLLDLRFRWLSPEILIWDYRPKGQWGVAVLLESSLPVPRPSN